MTTPAIGIDLGTSYSSVAVYRDGRVEVIPNEEGSRTTPSYVAFTDTERLVGSAAKNQDAINPTNTIYDTKRHIGRTFDDPMVKDYLNTWPFQLKGYAGKPKIVVYYKGRPKLISPEEVSSMMLSKMRNIAENYLKIKIVKAVITVPANFNDSQRRATMNAAAIAGIHVLCIINEPTASALAYHVSDENTDDRNILIFDLGGGTFDVSVLSIKNKVITVHSTAGNTHLGGQDFNNRMIDYFVYEILRKYQKDLRTNKTAMRRLRNACEVAKKRLSISKEAIIDLDYLFDDMSFQSSITRSDFEGMNMDLFKSMIKLVNLALKEATMEKTDIDDIVLIGGSTRIPVVQLLLREYFNGKELVRSVNPDEAVVCGAAVKAAMLNGDKSIGNNKLRILDVTPLSLGIKTFDDKMDVIIRKNSLIPVQETKTYTTSSDSQTAVTIELYEGEKIKCKRNNFLTRYLFDEIPPASSGVPRIDVTFEVDINGILNVRAVERTKQITRTIETINAGRLTTDEINKMVKEARTCRQKDNWKLKAIDAKDELERLCLNTKAKLEEKIMSEESDKTEKALKKCNEILTWLDSKQKIGKLEYIRIYLELRHISYVVL